MHRFFKIIGILILLTSISNCKSKKLVDKTQGFETINQQTAFKRIHDTRLHFQTLEFRGSADVDNEFASMSGSYILRIKNEEIAWLLVKKFGLEVARVLIKNDTVTAINRFEKMYWQKPISELSDVMDMDLSGLAIYDLLAGNPVISEENVISYHQDESSCNYTFSTDEYYVRHTYDVIIGGVVSTFYSDQMRREAEIEYSTFDYIDSKAQIPFKRKYKTTLPDYGPSEIELSISKYKIDEDISFPFEVPSHYQRIH